MDFDGWHALVSGALILVIVLLAGLVLGWILLPVWGISLAVAG